METKTWHVVIFCGENEVEEYAVVPKMWMKEDEKMCAWPSVNQKTDLIKLVANRVQPMKEWGFYPYVDVKGPFGKYFMCNI